MALTKLNLNFWSQVAGAWGRTLSMDERAGIERTVASNVADGMADLVRNATRSKIRPALEAILADDDDDDEEAW